MYYNRSLSKEFSALIEPKGQLRWLFDFVKQRSDLDFLIGRSGQRGREKDWISIYRGLTRIVRFTNTISREVVHVDAAEKYKKLEPGIFGRKRFPLDNRAGLVSLIDKISKDPKLIGSYDNHKEGYYQNELSRKYGICGSASSEFVIVDKEAVVGYENMAEKDSVFGSLRTKYKQLHESISNEHSKRYVKYSQNRSAGNELDFLGVDTSGNILLIEYKHGRDSQNTAGIYMSPLQIGLYYDIFSKLDNPDLLRAVTQMIRQKQKIGLIHPDWRLPKLNGNIIPVLIISYYNYNSTAKEKYGEIMSFVRSRQSEPFLKNIRTYNYTTEMGLEDW